MIHKTRPSPLRHKYSKSDLERLPYREDFVDAYLDGDSSKLEYWLGRFESVWLDRFQLLGEQFLGGGVYKLIQEAYEAAQKIYHERGYKVTLGEVVLNSHLVSIFEGQTLFDIIKERPSVPDMPDKLTRTEVVGRLLYVLWADSEFWKLLDLLKSNTANEDSLKAYLADEYYLHFPFPLEIWHAMLKEPIKREYMFRLMLQCADCFLTFGGYGEANPHQKKIAEELTHPAVNRIVDCYVHPEKGDPATLMGVQNFSRETLTFIKEMGGRIARDADWCLRNPGIAPAVRGPHPNRLRVDIFRVHHIESMVRHLHDHPEVSNYALAKVEFGKPRSAEREAAAQAKKLAFHRDNIKVKRHKRRGI